MRRDVLTRNATTVCLVVAFVMVFGRAASEAQFELPNIPLPDLELQLPVAPLPPTQAPYPPTTAPSAAGPYLAQPAWNQTLAPHLRFIILTNFGSDAVLDRETGLVWARRDVEPRVSLGQPRLFEACDDLVIGNRGGWRLPTAYEAMALVDFSVPDPDVGPNVAPRLAPGHPFALTPVDLVAQGTFRYFWYPTSDVRDLRGDLTPGRARSVVDLGRGQVISLGTIPSPVRYALCVRGAQ